MGSGQVKVVFFGFLIDFFKGREHIFEVDSPVKIRDLLRKISPNFNFEVVVVVNDYPATMDSYARPGDIVKVFPHIGGG
jgi:molybdopterin converting factor small subunit